MNQNKKEAILEFAEYLKLVRTERGLTLREVAEYCKLKSTNHLSMIENGSSIIQEEPLFLFCKLFGLPFEQMRRKAALLSYSSFKYNIPNQL